MSEEHEFTDELIQVLRVHHQIQIYTVNEVWCVQLFDLDVSANDQIDCVFEIGEKTLINALKGALEWVEKEANHD